MTQSQTTASSPATDPPAPVSPLQGHPTSGHLTLSHHQVPANTSQMAVLQAAALAREAADLAESYGALNLTPPMSVPVVGGSPGPPLFGALRTGPAKGPVGEGQMTGPTQESPPYLFPTTSFLDLPTR